MNDQQWQRLRVGILAGSTLATLVILGKAIATPKTTPSTAPTSLPETVTLPDWQLASATSLKADKDLPVGMQYDFRQAGVQLKVQARMMPGDGNISRFLFVHTPIKAANAKMQIKQHPDVGYYGVLDHDGRAYLSACVNPRGNSTVTGPQFTQNLYSNDFQVTRIVPWLMGQTPFLDQRCLWTFMSTPLPALAQSNPASVTATFKTLETVWFSWKQWWQSNYPAAPS